MLFISFSSSHSLALNLAIDIVWAKYESKLKRKKQHTKQSKKKGLVNRIRDLVVMSVVLNDGFCYSSYSSNSAGAFERQ